ncbi:hypothetical protein VTI74DRAFT_4370 [Chaetomium olivicolor]
MIDELRSIELAKRWRLRDPKSKPLPDLLTVSGSGPAVTPMNGVLFEPGGWWLSLTCAHLDGVIGTDCETTSRGDDRVPTLPLLSGREIHTGYGRVRYLREGTMADMHPALIPQTGKHVRVLRGNLLRSVFAPLAGIRNDGLWRVLRYSQKLDLTSGHYRLEVDLQKAPGQTTMQELMKIPRPSQLDDWYLYKKIQARKDDRRAALRSRKRLRQGDHSLGTSHDRSTRHRRPDTTPMITGMTTKGSSKDKSLFHASGDGAASNEKHKGKQKVTALDTFPNR